MKHFLIAFAIVFFVSFAKAQTPSQICSWLPVIDGWELSEHIEVFTPENLSERLENGDSLLKKDNFCELVLLEYVQGVRHIAVQAYRYASPEDAFGIYASERSLTMDFLPIGGEAQCDSCHLNFFAGNEYVKIFSDTDSTEYVMREIASYLSEKIDPVAAYPRIVRTFPAENKIPHTESYVASNFIGHEFLNRVYTAKYECEGQIFYLFVIDGQSTEGSENILTQYCAFTQQTDVLHEGTLLVKDSRNGYLPCIWMGRYIMGVYSESGEGILGADVLLRTLADHLK